MNLRVILITLLLATILLASSTLISVRYAYGAAHLQGNLYVPTVVTGNWEFVNYQAAGGSYSPQMEINRDNVEFLELKWIFPYSSVECNLGTCQVGSNAPPLVVDGVVYVAKNQMAIHALDAKDGTEIWFNDEWSGRDGNELTAPFTYINGAFGHVHAINYYREKGWLMMSSQPCFQTAWNANDGSIAWEMGPAELCGTNEQYGNFEDPNDNGLFANKGRLASISNHPPSFFGDIMVIPISGASGGGGRSSVRAWDMSDPQNPIPLIYPGEGGRTWYSPRMDGSQPTWAIDQCDRVNGNGWFFERPEFLRSGQLSVNCRDVPDNVLMNDWIDLVPSSPHFMEMHSASAIAAIWGNMPIDPETGIIYFGTGDIGPYTNATNKYGPNLHGSGYFSMDVVTGEMKAFFAAVPHDLWDQDCSWGGILGDSNGQKVYIKGCKTGLVHALDAATLEPVWLYDPAIIDRDFGSGAGGISKDQFGNPGAGMGGACCDMTREHMSKPWMNCLTWDVNTGICTDRSDTSLGPARTICLTECLESDIAFDGERVYAAFHNNRGLFQTLNVRDFGNQLQGLSNECVECVDEGFLEAIDVDTGRLVWSLKLGESNGFRGGLLVTGGVVYAYAADGNLYMVNSETGELLAKKFFGIPVSVAPTIGMDSDGKHKIFMHIGGGGGFLFGQRGNEGSLAAFGLPDVLPEPEIVEVEVEVPGPERVVEVPGPERIVEVEVPGADRIIEVEVPGPERIVEVEVPGPERIVEVPGPEVEIQTISPISYVAIGLGVVLVVISGVLFTRKRGT